MCHDVTQEFHEVISIKKAYHSFLFSRLTWTRDKSQKESKKSWRLIISLNLSWAGKRFRWNHHFSSRLTFCCIIVSVKAKRTNDRAISQNMPTIVYQTNRYWLSRIKRSWKEVLMTLQTISEFILRTKLIFFMTREMWWVTTSISIISMIFIISLRRNVLPWSPQIKSN